MKTAELTGVALDWAVAKCEGWPMTWDENAEDFFLGLWAPLCFLKEFAPSTDWSLGGPIIERERLCPCPSSTAVGSAWSATDLTGHITHFGPTPLIAAMRCYVASKLGDEVEIPKEINK